MRTTTANPIDQIRAEASTSASEICGALIGDGDVVTRAIPLVNASNRVQDSFYIPAADVLRIEREAERTGAMLMGFYHSHPHGDAAPSNTDLQDALPGYVYWIASRTGEVRAWRLRDDRTAFDEVEVATRDDG